MKRYIFLSALSMLFCTVMNFRMLDHQSSFSDRCAINKRFAMQCNIPTDLVDGDTVFMHQDGEVVVLSKQLRDNNKVCKFKPGKPLKSLESTEQKKQHFGLIIEEVERPEEKEVKEIIDTLQDRFGRTPTIKEIENERKRKELVRHCDEWADNNPELMEMWKKANEGLMNCAIKLHTQLVEQHKKLKEEAPDWLKEENPDFFK